MPPFTYNPGLVNSRGGPAACRVADIIQLVMDNFVVDCVYVEPVTELGICRVFIPGIGKSVQLAIHEFLLEHLPAGVHLDVHRSEPPESLVHATPVRDPRKLPSRKPKWI